MLSFFVLDERNPSSIRSCIDAARANARTLRHRISSELWLELNTMHLDAKAWSPAQLGTGDVFDFFSLLQERFYRIAGVMNGTLPRGLGFDFLGLGIRLERAENVTRLLDIKYHYLLPRVEDVGGPIDLLQWAAVLRSASALEAYRLTYGNLIRTDDVVEMIIFDPTFALGAPASTGWGRAPAGSGRRPGRRRHRRGSRPTVSPAPRLAQRRRGHHDWAARLPARRSGGCERSAARSSTSTCASVTP